MTADWVFDMAANVSPIVYTAPQYRNIAPLPGREGLSAAKEGFGSIARSMQAIGLLNEQQAALLRKVEAVAQVTLGAFMLAQAYNAAIASQAAVESVLAGGLLAANIALQNWPTIALAAGSAAAVAGAVTYAAGMWKFPMGDLSNPLDRARMASQARSVL